jgi:hypothetical protein
MRTVLTVIGIAVVGAALGSLTAVLLVWLWMVWG